MVLAVVVAGMDVDGRLSVLRFTASTDRCFFPSPRTGKKEPQLQGGPLGVGKKHLENTSPGSTVQAPEFEFRTPFEALLK